MRIEISYKFIIGFIVVVVSGILVNLVVPYLSGIEPEFRQVFAIFCSLVVGLIIGSLFSRAFSAKIRRLTSAGDRIRQGDLSEDVDVSSSFPDETSDLAKAMNQFQASLRSLVGDIRNIAFRVASSSQNLSGTSQEMSASAQEVARATDQITKGAETQAEMVEESTRLFKELAVSIKLVASSAKTVADSADQTLETARNGNDMAGSSLDSIRQVLTEAENSGQQMVNFIAQLQKISTFVEVINGIAQKTNLLALNATIEAARAGEYGHGFAVVAEEIRKLADTTTTSADEITSLVESIRKEGQQVQSSMAQVIDEMESGREAADRTNQAFSEITRNAEGTRSKASSIAELTEQQISSAERINHAIDKIGRVVSDNAAATEQVSAATQEQSAAMEEMAQSAKELSNMSESMLQIVKQFKLVKEIKEEEQD